MAAVGNLPEAAYRGDVKEVTHLLHAGVNVNTPDEVGQTALWLAVHEARIPENVNHKRIINLLLASSLY